MIAWAGREPLGCVAKPIVLRNGRADGLTYVCDFDALPATCGVYIFGRAHGDNVTPLYIGQAIDIAKRVFQHFYGNVPLTNRIRDESKTSPKVVIAGEWNAGRGQRRKTCLNVIERALIRHGLAEGHQILNDKGTKTPTHTIHRGGYRGGGFLPSSMNVAAR